MNLEGRLPEVVTRADERLGSMGWTSPEPLNSSVVERGGVLVCCGGFEDRAIGVLPSFITVSKDIAVLLIRYLPEYSENRDSAVREWAKNNEVQLSECTYDRRSPAGGGEAVFGSVE